MYKEVVAHILSKETKLSVKEVLPLLEIPPNTELGDYAFPCFTLSKTLKKSPSAIATSLAQTLKSSKDIERFEAQGPYLNIFINKKVLAKEILKIQKNYGTQKKTKKTIVIEFPGPNTNKPLHLGHLRNMAIGESVSRILEYTGNTLQHVNINNDRGIHICKSMLAYQKFGNKKQPTKKTDHFVGDFYVLFNQKAKNNPKLEQEAQALLKKWERGDKETLALWKKMNDWAYKGFKETYKRFGISIDKEYYESKTYTKGKEIIEEGLKKGIFKKNEDGATIINLEKEKLGEKVLLRADGTSVYITQDLALAVKRNEEYKPHRMIYVVADEQNYHFKVLFTILKKLGYSFADNLSHLSYGMINLPEGKMKSREGTIIDADDMIDEMTHLAKNSLKERGETNTKTLDERGLKIALAALKYYILKIEAAKTTTFNRSDAVSFEGNTGPYLQYTYARASSILRKATKKPSATTIPLLTKSETSLITKLSHFPEKVTAAADTLNPSRIANYAFELCQLFNEFYHQTKVIGEKEEPFRLTLIQSFQITLRNALYLLGIETLEEM